MSFVPAPGEMLTIQLPGEKVRALVQRVIDDDAILTELTIVPLTKNHQFKLGDIIACRRVKNALWGESWVAQIPKPYAILPDLTLKKEPEDAAKTGEQPKGDLGQHPRASPPRNKAKVKRPNRSDSLRKRKKASKSKGRRSGSA